ncbi:MAG: protein phosphatase 2C domain-containing protein [Actinomycetota bacterium]|nr:protein phosphatase 2C domain-containing protein [Actinomycetota bacterium]
MKIRFSGQVPKDPFFPEANEDFFSAVDPRCIALSDGASESYDSRAWAKLLVSQFLADPRPSQQWLQSAVDNYLRESDTEGLSWSKQAARERGSFATLLGVTLTASGHSARVYAFGDSLAVLLDGAEKVRSFPYDRSGEFRQRPELFCTNPLRNSIFADHGYFDRHTKLWRINRLSDPVLLLMTDALGMWALASAENGEPCWGRLVGIETERELETLVRDERARGAMNADDTTLIVPSLRM